MKFTKFVPNIFYADIKIGIKLFVDCLSFKITYNELHSDKPFCVVQSDGLKAHLVQDTEFAEKDRPEFRLETEEIEQVYESVRKNHPELLHPNASEVKTKPWKAKEFALRDESGVCVVIQQWPV